MPKISIIMPSLNVANYIKRCMQSVIEQTFGDIEILAIDAGSTDGTWKIIQDFAIDDPRVVSIRSEMQSYGFQINLGIAMAKGDYIGIVETDDFIEPQMYQMLYEMAVERDLDYVKGRPSLYYESIEDYPFLFPTAYPGEDYREKVSVPMECPELLRQDIFLWNGIYKRELLSKIRLNETPGAAFQDQGFLLQTISTATSACYLDETVYYYRQDNLGSSSNGSKGYHYILMEYQTNMERINRMSRAWQVSFFERLLDQCISRTELMARSLHFWDEAESDIDGLRSMLSDAKEKGILSKEEMSPQRYSWLEMFLYDPKTVYYEMIKPYEQGVKQIYILEKEVADRNLIVFGTGAYGKLCAHLLMSRKMGRIVSFCDNDPKVQKTTIMGLPVLSPLEAAEREETAAFVLAAKEIYRTKMREQLVDLGVTGERIIDYTAGGNVGLLGLSLGLKKISENGKP